MWNMDMFRLGGDSYRDYGFGGYGGYYDDFDRDPWSNRSEKSGAAERRESVVTNRFKSIRATVKSTLEEKRKVAVKLGCHPKSESPLKSLPGILIDDICKFAGLPEPKPRPRVPVAAAGAAAPDAREGVFGDIDLTDFSIYRPGEKIVIPLSTPNEHLTGPCWRDFSRTVRANGGWEVKRIAATPSEKLKYKEKRQGKCYFINVIFTVPGGKDSKKRATKKSSSTAPVAKKAKISDGDKKPAAKK